MPQYSDEEDPKLLNGLAVGTSAQTAPSPVAPPTPQIINQDGKQYEFLPGKEGSLTVRGQNPSPPPMTAPPPAEKSLFGNLALDTSPASPPVAKSVPLPGMPPSVRPEDISNYLNQQKTGIDKYGADQQMGLENKIVDQRNSLGYKAADAGKGFADALMMGVARAGNPGFQKQFEDQQNEQGQQQLGAMQHANEANFQGQQAKMGVDAMDPKSVASKTARDAYGPLFQKLGYKPGDIDGMSAANIQNALTLMTEYGGKQIEATIKEYELEIERARLGQVTQNQNSQRAFEEQKLKTEHPVLTKLQDMFGGSGNSPSADNRVTVISPTGKTGHIPASQLKDALAKGYRQS